MLSAVVVTLAISGLSAPPDTTSVARVLLQDYAAEVQKRIDNPELISDAWRRDWIGRFTAVVDSVSDLPTRRTVAINVLGDANAIEDYEISKKMLDQLIAMSKSPSEKAQWLSEKGTILSRLAATGKDPQSLIKAATAAYEEVFATLSSPGAGPVLPADREQVIRTYADLGILHLRAADAGSAAKARDYFAKGRAAMLELEHAATAKPGGASSPADVVFRRMQLEGMTPAYFSLYELEALGKSPDIDRAVAVLGDVAAAPKLSAPLSDYVVSFAERAFGTDTPKFQSFLVRWLATAPRDYQALLVRARLLSSYYITERFQEASDMAESTYTDEAIRVFAANEPIPFAERSGGHLSDALSLAAQAHHRQRRPEKAQVATDLFCSLFDKDPRCASLRAMMGERVDSPTEKTHHETFLRMILGFGALLVGRLLYVIHRARRAPRPPADVAVNSGPSPSPS